MADLDKLIEINEYKLDGYKPLVDYEGWRVAILNYCEELLAGNIDKMQKHEKTDEVFVLLKGRCILFIAEGDQEIENIYAKDMEPLKVYNIKKSIWHTHTLSEDAAVLIVENRNTNLANSPEKNLSKEQQKKLEKLTKLKWDQ